MTKQFSQPAFAAAFTFFAAAVTAMPGCNARGTSEAENVRSLRGHAAMSIRDLAWRTYGHDYGNQRFSPLADVDVGNVQQLEPAYVVQTGVVGPLETSPIVADSVMYLTTPSDGIIAVDAVTGQNLWRKQPLRGNFVQCCGLVNRGLAIDGDQLFIGRLDGVLQALKRETGQVLWSTKVAKNGVGYSITMAPVAYNGRVLVGVGGGEIGNRGSFSS